MTDYNDKPDVTFMVHRELGESLSGLHLRAVQIIAGLPADKIRLTNVYFGSDFVQVWYRYTNTHSEY